VTDNVVLLRPVAALGRAFSPPLPFLPRGESLPAPGGLPGRPPGENSGAPSPAAVIGLNGEPLYDRAPTAPAADFYATAPGVVWHALPTESEEQFFARVRAGAAAGGLDRVQTWRRHGAQGIDDPGE
jgi:hypothetical protein